MAIDPITGEEELDSYTPVLSGLRSGNPTADAVLGNMDALRAPYLERSSKLMQQLYEPDHLSSTQLAGQALAAFLPTLLGRVFAGNKGGAIGATVGLEGQKQIYGQQLKENEKATARRKADYLANQEALKAVDTMQGKVLTSGITAQTTAENQRLARDENFQDKKALLEYGALLRARSGGGSGKTDPYDQTMSPIAQEALAVATTDPKKALSMLPQLTPREQRAVHDAMYSAGQRIPNQKIVGDSILKEVANRRAGKSNLQSLKTDVERLGKESIDLSQARRFIDAGLQPYKNSAMSEKDWADLTVNLMDRFQAEAGIDPNSPEAIFLSKAKLIARQYATAEAGTATEQDWKINLDFILPGYLENKKSYLNRLRNYEEMQDQKEQALFGSAKDLGYYVPPGNEVGGSNSSSPDSSRRQYLEQLRAQKAARLGGR